jgi:hypothetical protein
MAIDLRSSMYSAAHSAALSATHLDDIGPVPAGIAAQLGTPGASLGDVLALVKQRVPTATALLVRDGCLFVAYAEPPDDATAAAARAVLADERALAELAARPARGDVPAAAAPGALAGAAAGDLRAQLLDAALSDADWLRAFRRYQVALLSTVVPGPE